MKVPNKVLLWRFGGIHGNLKAENNYVNNKGYNLYCTSQKKYLRWKTGMLSINLDYDSKPQNKYHFQLPDKKEREILTGEPVAMAIGGGEAFLYYGHQTFGINLKWSTKPLFEWRIYDSSGKEGLPIATGTTCALVNVKVDPDPDFLIHLEKTIPRVVDLGWTTSPGWFDRFKIAFKEVNKWRKEYF